MTASRASSANTRRIAIVGGGPAGLMAAEAAAAAGLTVDLYEAKGSVGRKFLLAGKGGLNLTHGEPFEPFVARYAERADAVRDWLHDFDADALRTWAAGLGVETFVGSSGRVFPADLKAAPLMRRWVHRLRTQGVRFHAHHRWTGWGPDGRLRFDAPGTPLLVDADACVLALGGASWPQLGSDGAWVEWLGARGVGIAPLKPANCGFDIGWSAHLATRFAGAPLKPVTAHWTDRTGNTRQRQGECVLTATGIEGSLIYAIGADLREAIARHGEARLHLDLAPGRCAEALANALARPRGKRSQGEWLRRQAGLDAAKAALVFECSTPEQRTDPGQLAALVKAVPLRLRASRPVAEAISTAGGVRLEDLDDGLMLRELPGVFCAGEMLDWEAPTGGYLLTACFASGLRAGRGAAAWVSRIGN